jgi:hypothetical protein
MIKRLVWMVLAIFFGLGAGKVGAAYHHQGEMDSKAFLEVYPDKAGSKLDSCSLCHAGGNLEKKPGSWVSLGSCQWCHYAYGYDKSGDISRTLNAYGRDYLQKGRSAAAVREIANLDSDVDGFTNNEEIAAVRYPGNSKDDPRKVTAPYRIYDKSELMKLPRHVQLMLMNTHKSPDYYAEYGGVTLAVLLDDAGKRPSATGIQVYSPDGWSQYYPFEADDDPLLYHVYGTYSQAVYYYHPESDLSANPSGGWCDYLSPACTRRNHGDPILNPSGLQMLLAFQRDGKPLGISRLTADNKLDGEGPFRVVSPQKIPGPPDQRSTAANQNVIWPFDENADHSAGFSTRTATLIKVEPLPDGTTDVDALEAGWNFVDEEKLIIYGAISPLSNILAKLDSLTQLLASAGKKDFKQLRRKMQLINQVKRIKQSVVDRRMDLAQSRLRNDFLPRITGNQTSRSAASTVWLIDADLQKQLRWRVNELNVFLDIIHPQHFN